MPTQRTAECRLAARHGSAGPPAVEQADGPGRSSLNQQPTFLRAVQARVPIRSLLSFGYLSNLLSWVPPGPVGSGAYAAAEASSEAAASGTGAAAGSQVRAVGERLMTTSWQGKRLLWVLT
jgi:hypothetical protein